MADINGQFYNIFIAEYVNSRTILYPIIVLNAKNIM